MAVLPFVSLISKGAASKSLAVVEGLVVVPLVGAALAYGLARAGLSFELGMAAAMIAAMLLVSLYARYATA